MSQNRIDRTSNNKDLTPFLGGIAVGRNCALTNENELFQMVRFGCNQVIVLDKYFINEWGQS